MSTTGENTAAETVDAATNADAGAEDTDGAPSGAQSGADTPNREAAKYRKQLREVEAERDRLAGKLEQMHRAEIRRAAEGARMHDPDDFTVDDVAELLNDDGDVDGDKVAQRLDALRESKQHLFQPPPSPKDFGGGERGADITGGDGNTTWDKALKPPEGFRVTP
ncbi:hypothetical protein BJF85_00225 [Saccharomonospora sp. CUA-673]|uniref:hypothetical protein n=1 Tax=Saccharomonospora sp. CUA-673 TaxID=1904969 RepID=UPI000966E87A|nr:hypothetical protein [Saccharomonospora sp. CUA-673]OLT46937.1 hypothetical protein BJF85_00225 [Saccharomonospora sp. CUA-673]